MQRPPFDRNNPPPPGGFNPRFPSDEGQPRGPDPRFDPRRDPRFDEPDPFERGQARPRGNGRGSSGGGGGGGGGINRWLLILGGLLLLGAVLFGLSLTRSGPGSDALGGAGDEGKEEETAAADDPEARCAAPGTYDRIKRELFRQAGATRGSDQTIFAQLPSYATLRVADPVLREQDAGLERVTCSASATLDLPPGLAVVGGRRSLSANIGYNLQPAADGSGEVVTLSGAEGIIVPLATIARVGGANSTPADGEPVPDVRQSPAPEDSPAAPTPPPPPEPARPPEAASERAPPPPAVTPPTAGARPSFNCARARTRGEIAVCNDAQLAALDRQMASFYQSAYRGGAPETRALLERTRTAFLRYRDRCRTDACVEDAYRGRITEIRDIADGRWRSPQ